jgi:hypothetical protein
MRIADWLLEKAQLRIEEAKTEKIRACPVSAIHRAFVRRLAPRAIRIESRRT